MIHTAYGVVFDRDRHQTMNSLQSGFSRFIVEISNVQIHAEKIIENQIAN